MAMVRFVHFMNVTTVKEFKLMFLSSTNNALVACEALDHLLCATVGFEYSFGRLYL